MHMPSITTDCLAVLALACIAIAFQAIRLRRSQTIFNGGILLAAGISIVAALPLLARLPWAELADEVAVQAVATLHFLEVAYTILTL
ncbi:hypothetical protein [Bradyrhizobium sp. BR 10289]|uniref:hypothetical protein n=1 Tax=Bradyrhizobium sp. BR 10289 TaxID=2749993 RepID=UPI001C6513CD|nr:hypothetical protein [Bradyrhizobium sp. BR 10289]MBW7973021.1 hypothetical protein [Bradyrhizobium sp. BR 10289]